jgi:predicted RNA-binding Zn-ribbon protein involved in translation (DUF1610 family)
VGPARPSGPPQSGGPPSRQSSGGVTPMVTTPQPPVRPNGTSDEKTCPTCGEVVKVAAKKCRFCMEWFDQ